MTRLLTLVGVASLTASLALAQGTLVAPVGANVADAGGTSQNYFRETAARWQSVYDTSVFTSQGVFSPIQINQISFRPAAGGIVPAVPYTYTNAEVYLQYAAVDHAAAQTTWALNRSVALPTTPNYLGSITVNTPSGATPVNSDDVVITLTTPFVFDPSLGQDLLFEILLPTAPAPLPVLATDVPVRTCAFQVPTARMQSVRYIGAAASTSAAGTLTAFTPVTKFDYTIPAGVAKHDPYGNGCYDIALSWYERFAGAYPASTNDLSNTTVQAFANGNGGYTVVTLPGANVVMPTGAGLALGDDQVTASAISLPFTFDYQGGSTTSIWVDSNGSIALNGAAAPASVNNTTSVATILNATNHRIYASLQDLLPDGATNLANVFAEPDPANPTSVFLITWVNVPCFQTTPSVPQLTSTFQIALIDGGAMDNFELRFLTLTNDSDSYAGAAITGFSLGNGAIDPGSSDLTLSVVQTETEKPGLALFGSPRPVLGQPVTYTLSNMRANLGIGTMLASFGQIPGGLSLPSIGIPAAGCNAYIDPLSNVAFGPLLFGSPTAGFSNTWPTGPWSGVTIYVQGFELVPGMNPAGVISSNGMKVELGIY